MNIIIYAAVDFPAGPASTSRVKHIAKILVEAGNQVTVASLQANTRTPFPENSRVEGEFEGIRFVYLSGKTVRPAGFLKAVADTLRGSIAACAYLLRRKRQRSVDLVLYYTPEIISILPSLLIAKLLGIPVVLELCELYSTGYISNLKHRVGVASAKLSDKYLPRLCSGTIVISTRIGEMLLANGVDAQDIFHLPILVDCNAFAVQPAAAVPLLVDKKYLLNSGALGEKDGSNYLLAAFALLNRQHDEVFLVFTGAPSGSSRRYVLGLAEELGIAKRIIFTGYLSDSELVWAYHHAAGLVCCRHNSRFANFGSPTKLSEYLATGRPVITNEVGDNALYLAKGKSAFIARVEDSESIAEQMHLLLSDPAAAEKIGLQGRQVAKECFHYENYVSPLGDFLTTCVKERKIHLTCGPSVISAAGKGRQP